MSKKMVALSLLAVVFAFIIASLAVNPFLPEPLDAQLEFWDISPKEGMVFQSEDLNIGSKTYFIYAALCTENTDDSQDKYVVAVGEIKGIRKNKYDIWTTSSDPYLSIIDYSYVSNYPEFEVKKGSKYLGSIYVGIVPASCTSVTIDNEPAKMVRQTFQLNGQSVDFYLYYCAIEQSQEPDQAAIIVTDLNGHTYSIHSIFSESDGGEIPSISQIH